MTGSHNIKVGMQYQWGTFYHTRDANADLTQQYRENTIGGPFVVRGHGDRSATRRSRYGEQLNYDIGLLRRRTRGRLKRLTVERSASATRC